ncbi:MAG: glutaredoxin [Prochlorococcaceae cyanobacterium]
MPDQAPASNPASLPQPVHLHRLDAPDHHCAYGERARQLLEDRGIPFHDHRLTSQEEAERFQAAHGVTSTPQVFAGSERIGGYSDLAVRLGAAAAVEDPDTGTGRSYRPVLAVFAVAALAAWALGAGVVGFMGLAVTVLATLKLMDPPAFRRGFRLYDLLMDRWRGYGVLYPWLELLVGLAILGRWTLPALAVLAIAIGLEGALSVVRAVWIEKRDLDCACIGGNNRTPLGALSLLENGAMAAMGVAMLLPSW